MIDCLHDDSLEVVHVHNLFIPRRNAPVNATLETNHHVILTNINLLWILLQSHLQIFGKAVNLLHQILSNKIEVGLIPH